MAGIGFVLRKLTERGDIAGAVEAYIHAIFASTGPWILTICTIWIFFFIGDYWRLADHVEEFRVIVLYNFSFSLVFTAPITMIATRYLADGFFKGDVSQVSGLLLGVLVVQLVISLPLASYFYLHVVHVKETLALLAIIDFLLISGIWITMVFISSLKYYSVITFTFLTGMCASIGLAWLLSGLYGSIGMLLGFNCGLGFILASFIAIILSEYPSDVENIFGYFSYFKKYWQVALSGTCYNLGIWIDKWMMWFSPERRELPNLMIIYPEYDVAMFVAYMTIIPAMALFLIYQETSFFQVYVRFYRGISQNDSFRKIEKNHQAIFENLVYNGRNLVIVQATIAFFCIVMAPTVMNFLGMNLVQISVFRFGILGAAFQILTLFMMITLSYFDDRKHVLTIAATFLVTNALFTYICMQLGFAWYGYGYCLSCIVTFALASVLTERYVNRLPYHTFITRNLTL